MNIVTQPLRLIEYSCPRKTSRGVLPGTCLALLLVLIGACQPTGEAVPEAPIGGALSRPMPHADVLGFVRLHPGGMLWSQVEGLLPQAEDLAAGTGVEPLVRLLQLYMQEGVLQEGSPLVVLCLDAAVHGFPFALAVQDRPEELRRCADQDEGLALVEDGGQLLLDRRPASLGMGMAMMFLDTDVVGSVRHRDENEALAPVTYHRTEEQGYRLVLPARDGRRNLRECVESAGAFETLPGVDYVQMNTRRVVGGISGALEMFLQSGLFQGVVQGMVRVDGPRRGHGTHRWDPYYSLRRAMVRLAMKTLRECEQIDYLSDGTDHQLFLRVAPGGLLSRLGRVMPERPREELLAGVPQGAGVVAVSLDGDPLHQLQRVVANELAQHGLPLRVLPLSRGWWSMDLIDEVRHHAYLGASEEDADLAAALQEWIAWWDQGLGPVLGGTQVESTDQIQPGRGSARTLTVNRLPWPLEPLPLGLLMSAESDGARRQRLVRQASTRDPLPWARSVAWPDAASLLFQVDLGLVRMAGSVHAQAGGFLVNLGPGRR